jgi:hypothetical protein
VETDYVANKETELRAEIDRLSVALREDPSKWSWDVLLMVGRRLLDEVYPEDVFDGSSGDTGPAYIVALRAALVNVTEEG